MNGRETPLSAPLPVQRGRIKALVVSSLIGPGLAGVILYLLLLQDHSHGWFRTEPRFFNIITATLVFGSLPAMIAGLGGLWLLRRSPTVSVWDFLLMATVAVIIMVIMFAVYFGDLLSMSTLLLGMAAYIPALVCAPVCWRLTRSWHSPERNP